MWAARLPSLPSGLEDLVLQGYGTTGQLGSQAENPRRAAGVGEDGGAAAGAGQPLGSDIFAEAHLQLLLQRQAPQQLQQQQQQRLPQEASVSSTMLQQAGAAAGGGSDLLTLSQTLAAAGLLGLPQLGTATNTENRAAPRVGQQPMQGFGGLTTLGGLDLLGGLQALQGMGGLQALQSLGGLQALNSLGALPNSLGLPDGATSSASFPPPQQTLLPDLNLLQQQLAQQRAQPQPAAVTVQQRGSAGSVGGSSHGGFGLQGQDLLRQLQQMTGAGAGTTLPAAMQHQAPPTSAAAAAAGSLGAMPAPQLQHQLSGVPSSSGNAAPLSFQWPASHPTTTAAAGISATPHSTGQEQQATAAGGRSRPNRRKLPSGKVALMEPPPPQLPPQMAATVTTAGAAASLPTPVATTVQGHLPGGMGLSNPNASSASLARKQQRQQHQHQHQFASGSLPPFQPHQVEVASMPLSAQQQQLAALLHGDGSFELNSGDEQVVPEGREGGVGVTDEADRLAEARRKNREAQQRFRERQRAAAREAEERYTEMEENVNRLRIENKELEQRNRFMLAALAVRDSMLLAFSLGQPSGDVSDTTGGGSAAAPVAAAAATMEVGAEGSCVSGTAATPAQPLQPPPPQVRVLPANNAVQAADDVTAAAAGATAGGEASRVTPFSADAAAPDVVSSGRAAMVLGAPGTGERTAALPQARSLRNCSSTEIEEVEPASQGALEEPIALNTARELVTPEDYTAYYQQSQVEMRFALQLCAENGATEEDRRAVEATHRLMQDVWQQVMRLFPGHIKTFLREMSAPDGTEGDRWEAVAAALELSDADLQLLHKAYRRYLKQSARIGLERSHLHSQLQRAVELHKQALADLAAWAALQLRMQSQAGLLLEVLDVAQGLNVLAEQEFHLIMDFCLSFCNALGQFQMALCNAEASPFVPNFLEISRRVLRRATENGRLIGSNGARLGMGEVEAPSPKEGSPEEEGEGEGLQLPHHRQGDQETASGEQQQEQAGQMLQERQQERRLEADAPAGEQGQQQPCLTPAPACTP